MTTAMSPHQYVEAHRATSRIFIACMLFALAAFAAPVVSGVPETPIFASSFEASEVPPTDLTGPVVTLQSPANEFVPGGATPTIIAEFEDPGSGVDPTRSRLRVDGNEVTAAAVGTPTSIRYVVTAPLVDGEHTVALGLVDNSGNETNTTWSFHSASAPEITDHGPEDSELPSGSLPTFTASFRDLRTGIDRDGIRLLVNEVDVTAGATITLANPQNGTLSYTPTVAPPAGRLSAHLIVPSETGLVAQEIWGLNIAVPAIYRVVFRRPAANATVTEGRVLVDVGPESNRAIPSVVSINGQPAESVPDPGDGRVTYVTTVDLVPGANLITAEVLFEDGETRSATTTVTYDAPPQPSVTTPRDFETLGPLIVNNNAPTPGSSINLTGSVERPVTITGTINRPVARVTINQQQAQLGNGGTSFTFPGFFLHEGTNLLSVNATDASGRIGTSQITVFVDQTAPLLTIEGPSDDAVTSAARVDVRGVANDAVEGGINAPEPSVTVRNAANAQSVVALVSDRYYIGHDVPLEVGVNVLTVTATDALGNARTKDVRVVRIAAGSRRITKLSGDRQSAPIKGELPQPLVVAAIGADGLPLANLPVRFDVLRGSGFLALTQGQIHKPDGINPARNLVVNTDASGRASVWLTLGSEAQSAGNMLRAWNEEIAEDSVFSATGVRGVPKWVLVSGAAGSQYAATDSQPVDALTAVVLDADRNAMTGASVVFSIRSGDARFTARSAPGGVPGADGKTITALADKNGQASVRLFTGSTPGTVRVSAEAELAPAVYVGGAEFHIMVLARRDGPTAFAGSVQDHTGAPLAGVRLSISRTSLSAVSDAAGVFRFEDQVPPGKIDLFVDGRNASGGPNIEYPALHFETAIIQGQVNQLPHPIYLPPIDTTQSRIVGGDADVSLTIPGLEGFEMIVKAGSVTFPDGSRVGPLVVTAVHGDRLPMVPPGGFATFSPVAWTIQPTGTRFDPPIEVKIPNTAGLRRGETLPIVQWDHDLATFVPMGRGTVSEDGTRIVSDAGSGITKAGWGGGPPPPPPNCGTNSNEPILDSFQIRTYIIKRLFGILWEYDQSVAPDYMSKNYPNKFRARVNVRTCNTLSYAWQFGDGGGAGTGQSDEVRHRYALRGAYQVDSTARCDYSSCSGPAFRTFNESIQIFARDEDWIEYREFMDECGWTVACSFEAKGVELLRNVLITLEATDIDWLNDLRQWNTDRLEVMGQVGGLSAAHIHTLAVIYALNTTFFPSSALDFNPQAKAVKAMSVAVVLGARQADELLPMADQVVDIAGETSVVLLRWRRLEIRAVEQISALRRGIASYFPTRGRNNGFDGAVVWREPDGDLAATIGESKCWSAGRTCRASDLSAFGLRSDPTTLRRNIDTLIEYIERNPPPGASPDEIADLISRLRRKDFDVILHGLSGQTQFDQAGIESALRALGMTDVKFQFTDV